MNIYSYKEILKLLEHNDEEAKKEIEKYEQVQNFEIAYLIKWQVVENIIKEIAKTERKQKLELQIKEWYEYINFLNLKNQKRKSNSHQPRRTTEKNKKKKINKPNSITKFNIDSPYFPRLKGRIDENRKKHLSNLHDLINSDKEYRKRRNYISHNFKKGKFKNNEEYLDYKSKIESAIVEIKKELAKGTPSFTDFFKF